MRRGKSYGGMDGKFECKKIVKVTHLGHVLNWKILLNLLNFEKPKISKSMVETHPLKLYILSRYKIIDFFFTFLPWKISITKSFEQRLFT